MRYSSALGSGRHHFFPQQILQHDIVEYCGLDLGPQICSCFAGTHDRLAFDGRLTMPRARRVPWASAPAARDIQGQLILRSTFFSGRFLTLLPVAAKTAFSTAGAATAMVGSPTPPQKPPEGTVITSTTGISSRRITS